MVEITIIGNRRIVLKGVGKAFYQDGFPISLSISILKKQNLEVSYLHIADELLKNGWKPETILTRLNEDNQDSGEQSSIPVNDLHRFVYSDYEGQRAMIFAYLFEDNNHAKQELREYFQQITK